jgi:small subunit ribosomal protein S14
MQNEVRMATTAKNAELLRDLERLDKARKQPDKSKLRPRDKIRIRLRCRLCGRSRAVYRKFGICRICFRNMASSGLIPGVKKASW